VRLPTNGIRDIETRGRIYHDPGAIAWSFSRSETIADLTVHIIGLCLGICAAAVLLALASLYAATVDLVAVSIYSIGLLSTLTLSAAYNLWPVCPTKWRLRRFDQSAIYVMIAATYTPFVLDTKAGAAPLGVLIGVWCVAALGIAVKLTLPGRFERFSIVVCTGMGWSAVILWRAKDLPIPFGVFRLLLVGGALVTIGLIFHVWQKLRFQNAIWHVFVLLGIACQYVAVFNAILG
jgi:hemolysin III